MKRVTSFRAAIFLYMIIYARLQSLYRDEAQGNLKTEVQKKSVFSFAHGGLIPCGTSPHNKRENGINVIKQINLNEVLNGI